MNHLAGVARRMQSLTDFPASPGPACSFCEWRPQCPEAAEAESGDLAFLLDEELTLPPAEGSR
jgi:hypothetical protein